MCQSMGRLFFFGFIGFLISWAALYHRYSDDSKRDARKYKLATPPELTGSLSVNSHLSEAVHILEGQIVGPESLVVDDEAIYATLYDGRIAKIVNGDVVASVKLTTKSDCGHYDAESECGRPLGIRRLVSNKQKFVVADAYLGLFVVDFDADKPSSTQIYKSSNPIGGRQPRFLNDVDVINEDELIVSDSSTKYDRRRFMPLILEQVSNGRIFHYKISTKTATVLVDNLYFPNGIQLLPDNKSVLFSECSMARIKRLWIDSKRVETFASNLPGMPDNIRVSPRGTFWVGLAATRHSSVPSLVDHLGQLPGIRQFLVDIIPSKFWETILHVFKKPHSMILELDASGRIIRSLHDTTGRRVGDVSQVTEYNKSLYLGSFNSPYIAKVDL